MRALTATVIILVAALGDASPAEGFVRKTSGAGVPERWPQSCVPVTVYRNGYAALTRDEVAKSVAAAARTWGPDAVTCPDGSPPYLELVTSMADDGATAPPVAYDGHNSVVFETEGWSGSDPSEVAVTYTFTQPGGRVVDADLRVNAAYHSFANLDPGVGGDVLAFDLQNAITHELGHLLGLGHTCLLDPEDPRPVDDRGNAVPYCSDAAAGDAVDDDVSVDRSGTNLAAPALRRRRPRRLRDLIRPRAIRACAPSISPTTAAGARPPARAPRTLAGARSSSSSGSPASP